MPKKTHRNMYCDQCHTMTDHLKISIEEFTKSIQPESTSSEEGMATPEITPRWIEMYGKPYKCAKCSTTRSVKLQHQKIS